MTGPELSEKRRRLKISQDELALAMGWARATVIEVERARIQIADPEMERASNAVDQIAKARLQAKEGAVAA